MVKDMKEIHPDQVLMIKIGSFYKAYNKDAWILSFLAEYKILRKVNADEIGFPKESLNRVMARLEDKKISYKVFDRRNNYELDEEKDFKNKNRYDEFYENSKKSITLNLRIDGINKKLNYMKKAKKIEELLSKIEDLIHEYRNF